jgi:hypothetical protein
MAHFYSCRTTTDSSDIMYVKGCETSMHKMLNNLHFGPDMVCQYGISTFLRHYLYFFELIIKIQLFWLHKIKEHINELIMLNIQKLCNNNW